MLRYDADFAADDVAVQRVALDALDDALRRKGVRCAIIDTRPIRCFVGGAARDLAWEWVARAAHHDAVALLADSRLEVEAEEEDGMLWHIAYPVTGSDERIVVATTRPEGSA